MAIQLSRRLQRLFQIMGGEHEGGEAAKLLGQEVKSLAIDSDVAASVSGVGAAAGTGVSAVEYGDVVVHKTVLTLLNVSIVSTDATTDGAFGTQKVYDFPEGAIQFLGASYNLSLAKVGSGIAATAAVVVSLGSVAAVAGDTLTSTEADMIASTSATLSSGLGTAKKHGSLIATAFDGHTTPLDAILNFAMPDAGTSVTDAIVFNGTITILWANSGDY